MSGETWLPIAGAPGYEVSDLGNVRGVDRTVYYRDGRTFRYRGAPLKPTISPAGVYPRVRLSGRCYTVHSLVLNEFVGPPSEGMECRHLNGNALDNRLTNLCWGTHHENCRDIVAHGNNRHASKATCIRGHLLVPPNLLPSRVRNGQRKCLACMRAKSTTRKAAIAGSGLAVDMKTVADRRYALIMAGVPSGARSFEGDEMVGLDRDWVSISRRRGICHARATIDRAVAACGRPLSTTSAAVTSWTGSKQCRNCARLIVAGVGWS